MPSTDPVRKIDSLRFCVGGLFTLALIAFLFVSRAVLLPVILSLILMLILRPFYAFFRKYFRFPPALAGLAIVLGLAGSLFACGYFLADPASRYFQSLENKEVRVKLARVFSPLKEIHTDIVEVAKKVDQFGSEAAPLEDAELQDGPDNDSTRVEIQSTEDREENQVTVTSPIRDGSGAVSVQIQESAVEGFYDAVQNLGFHALSTLVLLYFLLIYGEEMAKRLGQARGTPDLLVEIEKKVSGYLFSITAINIGLGVCIAVGLSILGLPNPVMWGLMAALLNFIPYAGALIGTAIVTIIAAMEFQLPGPTLGAAAIYFGFSAIEGNFVTPSLIGARFEINPIIIFVWVLAWAAIWGLPGMLIGLPLLIIFKIVCSQVPSLERVERAISVQGS